MRNIVSGAAALSAVVVGCSGTPYRDADARADANAPTVLVASAKPSADRGDVRAPARPKVSNSGTGRTTKAAAAVPTAATIVDADGDATAQTAPLELMPSGPDLPLVLEHCVDDQPFPNRVRTFAFAVREGENDQQSPSLPPGTSLSFTASNGTIVGRSAFTIAAGEVFPVALRSDAQQGSAGTCFDAASAGLLTVRIETPLGNVTKQSYPLTD